MTLRSSALVTTALALGATSVARAQQCPRLPTNLVCAPVPDDQNARRELLQMLDLEGREAVSRGNYLVAAAAFGCLVATDPTPESAGNLAVVLREQAALGDALLMARCAEQLAAPGPARERAEVRRLDIERRLGLTPAAAAPDLTQPVNLTADQRAPVPAPSGQQRRLGYAALIVGATLLIGSGVLYAVGRQRANQFNDEQRVNGYSDRARELRDDSQTLEIGTWLGAGVGAVAAVAGGALLRF